MERRNSRLNPLPAKKNRKVDPGTGWPPRTNRKKQNSKIMKYFIRSLKYFCALCVLCAAIMYLNRMAGTARLTVTETLYVMFHTPRGMMLPAVILLLAAFYPKFGFIVRQVEGDIDDNREQILNAFRSEGFSLRSEHDGVMVFRADNWGRKLMMLGEDELIVSQYGQWIRIEGIRRGVARVQYRLDSFLEMIRRNE